MELAFKPIKPTKPVKYEITETANGTWKKYQHEGCGGSFKEYRSHAEWFGLPLIHYVSGADPETKKMATAKGIIAVGQRASGVIAVGQFANGYLSVGQFCTGRIAAVGQFVAAPLGLGQFSIAVLSMGQAGLAGWGIFQMGVVFFGGFGQSVVNLLNWIPTIL